MNDETVLSLSEDNESDFAFTDGMFDDATLYAKLATEHEKLTLAYRHHSHLFMGLRMVNKGLAGWRERGVAVEEGQALVDFIDFELDPTYKFDCTKLNCHPNDPTKYHEDNPDTDTACDFYQSQESEVNAGGTTFRACQSACFSLTKQVDPESGRPLPRGNYFLPGLDDENRCRAINQQLLTFALVPVSRYSRSGRLRGFNTADVPPFSTDASFGRMSVNYPYCQYFQRLYDREEKTCYYSVNSLISQFLFGDVLTNWMFLEDNAAINSSLPKVTKLTQPSYTTQTTTTLTTEEVMSGRYYPANTIARAREIQRRFLDRVANKKLSDDTFHQEDIADTVDDLFALFSELSFFSEAENLREVDLKRLMRQIVKDEENSSIAGEEVVTNFNILTNVLFLFRNYLLNSTLGRMRKDELLTKKFDDESGEGWHRRRRWRESVRARHESRVRSYYSVNPRKNPNTNGGGNNVKPVMHRVEENPWLHPLKNVAVKIWTDLLSFEQNLRNGPVLGETKRKFEFNNNLVATLLASTTLDNAIVMLGKQTKALATKLVRPTSGKLLALSSRTFGVKAGTRIVGKAIVAQVTRKVANVVVKVLLKVAVQMLKLLAKLATAVFSVVAFVLTAFSVLGFILDFAVDYSWAEQYTSADELERYSEAFRESFRHNMNITATDLVTAPFSVKDLLAYVADANMGEMETFGIDAHGETVEEIFNQKSIYEATEDELFNKHYYHYLSTRTVNTFGQPIHGPLSPAALKDFDAEKQMAKIRNDLYEISSKGTVYADAVAYNASRLPLRDIADYEERHITDAITKETIELNNTAGKLTRLLQWNASLVGLCFLSSLFAHKFHRILLLGGMIFFFIFMFCLLYLLVIVHQIESNHLSFLNSTKLFRTEEMSPSLFAERKGAAKYEELISDMTHFTASFMKPFNDALEREYPPC